MEPKVIEFKDYEEFVAKTASLGHRIWVFRGHGRTGWKIESSLTRHLRAHQKNIDAKSHDVRESDCIRKFRRSAHQFLHHLPANNEPLAWLAIMQHFGAPTRLIDFTYSPFVGLFFAVADAGPKVKFGESLSDTELDERYGAYEVHALHIDSIREHTRSVLGKKTGDPQDKDYCVGSNDRQEKIFVGFFEGNRLNARQVAQQGLFLVPSKIDVDIEDYLLSCKSSSNFSKNSPWVVFRNLGGRKAYSEMVYKLINANLTAESLFPGLEGVARSLYLRWYQRGIALP
jgi:hypothetical protein